MKREKIKTRSSANCIIGISSDFIGFPAPPHFELGVQNRLNQLCSNWAQLCWNYFQLYWSLSPEYCGGVLGKQQFPHGEFWIRNNGNQLCCNFFLFYRPLFSITSEVVFRICTYTDVQVVDSVKASRTIYILSKNHSLKGCYFYSSPCDIVRGGLYSIDSYSVREVSNLT